MKQRLIGAALSASLLFNSTTTEASRPPESRGLTPADLTPISASLEQDITRDFLGLRSYWAPKNAGMLAVRLEIITGDESFNCGTADNPYNVRSTNIGALQYCQVPNALVLSQAGINSLQGLSDIKDIPLRPLVQLVEAHELGHAMQKSQDINLAPETVAMSKQVELQADCYGGQAMGQLAAVATTHAPAFYTALDASPDPAGHGLAPERIANFERGASGGFC